MAIKLVYILFAASLSYISAFVTEGTFTSSLRRLSSLGDDSLKASSPKTPGGDAKEKAKKSSKSTESKATASKKSSKVSKEENKALKEEPQELVFRKPEFIDKLAQKTGMTKIDSETALSAVLEIITQEVSAGKRVSMVGFGAFKLNKREARKGRNPKTGEEIEISASKYPSFIAGKSFKESCNI